METTTGTAQAAQPLAEKKFKELKPNQTNCDEKDAKGKPCWGQLKIMQTATNEIKKRVPDGSTLYRCQVCQTIYYGPLRQLPLRRVPRRISILG